MFFFFFKLLYSARQQCFEESGGHGHRAAMEEHLDMCLFTASSLLSTLTTSFV